MGAEHGVALERPSPCRTVAEGGVPLLQEAMGPSEQVRCVIDQVRLVAPTNLAVLITGETGSGKELVAQAVHRLSRCRDGLLVPVDCGSIPSTLIESELFGHEKGAFTGALQTHPGKFQAAAGGTLFLDEISNLPISVQPKLLRALQERQTWRVGGTQCISTNARFVAATNQNLSSLVEAGKFRRDLFHRLNEFSIAIPSLRDRQEDIPYLARRFVVIAARELKKNVESISESSMSALLSYHWPGNVRELRNVIRRAVLTAETRIEAEHLRIGDAPSTGLAEEAESGRDAVSGASLREAVRLAVIGVERKMLVQALQQTNGNKARAARLLQIDYKTIHNKVRQYGISFGGLAETCGRQ